MQKYLKKILVPLVLSAAVVFLLDIGCPIRKLTGFPCPGCGMTRACLAALKLDFSAAFHYHPLWFLPVPLFLLSVLHPDPLFKSVRLNSAFWAVMAVLIIGVYFVRMLLLFPHTPPMDYDTGSVLYVVWKTLTG